MVRLGPPGGPLPRECVRTGAAGARTRRSLGYHLLHLLILRPLVLCTPAETKILITVQIFFNNTLRCSDAASGWAGWALAQPDFGSSVNPTTTIHNIGTKVTQKLNSSKKA